MGLECRDMTGVDYKCPNISTCHENSYKHSMIKIIYYVLNQQICELDNIKVNDKSVADLLQETNQDERNFATEYIWLKYYLGITAFYILRSTKRA